jgi:hypothetical protein
MGYTIRDLLETEFEELYETAGVGQKKISALVELLARVAATKPIQEPEEFDGAKVGGDKPNTPGEPGFDPALVSELAWQSWREAVLKHGLGKEPLGRFAATLDDLPRVVWTTPLETYAALSLNEVRSLKTHGEKRVRVVVEIFGCLHRILGHSPVGHLAVRIVPRFVQPVETWLLEILEHSVFPDADEIRSRFAEPLLEQVRIDAGDQIADLAASRLGLGNMGPSVKQVAKKLNLTRARVYQLLNDIQAIMAVRWPEGVPLVGELRARLYTDAQKPEQLELFEAAVDLFFPQKRRIHGNGHLLTVTLSPSRQAM